MASRYGKYVPHRGPKQIKGWLRVCEGDFLGCEIPVDSLPSRPTGRSIIDWRPYYCMLRTDEQTIKHYKTADVEGSPVSPRSMAKVICGKEDYERHYGVELPITEVLNSHTFPGQSSRSRDSSYDRAVEEDRRGSVLSGSVLSGTLTRPTFSLNPSDDISDRTSINSSYSESKATRRSSGGIKSQFIRRARSITKLDKKRNATSPALTSKTSSGSVQDMNGWSYLSPNADNSSNSFSTLPSYRCATTNSASVPGGDGSVYTRETATNGSVLGRLKRSLSLTRLTKKRSRSRISETDEEGMISPPPPRPSRRRSSQHTDMKVKAARSCESLLAAGNRIASLDLGEGDIQVTSLHSSMLGEDNCIQLTSTTTGSSTYYSCRSSEERSQWLNHLRKTVNPGEEQMRRSDVSLKISIQEAKHCPNKKRYYCEISLDKALYAKTSTKHKADMLFWGEQFDFSNLPSIKSVTVTLYREADKKKKRDKETALGYVTLLIADLQNRQLYEKWHTLCPSSLVTKSNRESKTELPQIRFKIRHQTVEILPLTSYNPLLKYLKSNYQCLVERLEPLLSVRAKGDVSSSLIHILQREQLARRFLCDTIISEVPKHENLNLMLRGNTIATKAVESYMKLVGNKYLHDTLEDFIRLILDSEDSCEVDPGKLQNNSLLQRNQCNLISYCEMVWGRIMNSHSYFPRELRDVFTSFRRQCEHLKKSEVSDNLISACIFLRFICPAIMSPSLFELCQELPGERQSRNLTLVAKTLQSLANFTKFGSKEDYMVFMNEFVDREWNQMENFLKQISSASEGYPTPQFEGHIDCGKHLSLLHSQLVENLPPVSEPEKAASQSFADIRKILTDITNELEDPAAVDRQSGGSGDLTSGSCTNSMSRVRDAESTCSISSHYSPYGGSTATAPPARPESDEYVELCEDRTTDYTSPTQVKLKSSRDVLPGSGPPCEAVQSAQPCQTSSHYQQRPTLTVGQESTITTSQQVLALARLPDNRPKDPDADVSNRSDSDTLKSTSSTGSRKIVRHRVWDRVLTSNDLVNAKSSNPRQASREQPLAFVNPAFKHSTSNMMLSPRRLGGSGAAEGSSSPEFTPLPNKFNSLNLRGRNNKMAEPKSEITSPQTLRRFNYRDHPRSSAQVHHTEHHLPSVTRPYHTSDHPQPGGASLDLTHRGDTGTEHSQLMALESHLGAGNAASSSTATAMVEDEPSTPTGCDSHRDEKRFGCAKFPAMELYPETSARPQPDGSNAYDLAPAPHPSTEQLLGHTGDRPNTPTSSLSNWGGSQMSLNSQQTGIRNIQKSIDETAKIKQEYEAEVTVLRTQLSEAQGRLGGTEVKLAYQAEQTNQVMEEWKVRLDESEERLRAQQHEKDEQIKNIIQRLLAIEEDLRQEQQEMKSAISRKEQIIESQERRIRELDTANVKLQKTLSDMKERMQSKSKLSLQSKNSSGNSSSSTVEPSKTYKTTLYVSDYNKSSFC